MKGAVFAFSRQGCRTAEAIRAILSDLEISCYTLPKFQMPGFLSVQKPSADFYGNLFRTMDALIFVGACGIAVREIAPHVRDKKTDPAVLVVDELGKYVIPLLSGHIGGANALAEKIAEKMNAVPVITTATDINRKFSVDAWAVRSGCVIGSMDLAKQVSSSILEHDLPLCSDYPIVSPLPGGIVPGNAGELGICISCRKDSPFVQTLHLFPRILHLGIGCRKGIPESAVSEAVDTVLETHHISPDCLCCVASIDLKKEEPGLLAFCRHRQLPVSFYSAAQLNAVKGNFTSSAFVSGITGVDNVCERAALLGAHKLIVRKTIRNGVTVALAEEKMEVNFG